jgi:hypothetical protein
LSWVDYYDPRCTQLNSTQPPVVLNSTQINQVGSCVNHRLTLSVVFKSSSVTSAHDLSDLSLFCSVINILLVLFFSGLLVKKVRYGNCLLPPATVIVFYPTTTTRSTFFSLTRSNTITLSVHWYVFSRTSLLLSDGVSFT